MRSRNRGVWSLAGLAVFGTMLAGGAEARAGAITIMGGYVPYGDPQFEYIFDVELNPGSSVYYGDHFTIDGLVGVTTGSLSNVVSSYLWLTPTINQTSTTGPGSSDVTWAYGGTTPIDDSTGTNPIALGTFEILTTYSFPPGQLPIPPGSPITYTWSVNHGTVTGSDTFNIQSLPEPSAVLLLLTGAAMPALAVVRRRLRRAG